MTSNRKREAEELADEVLRIRWAFGPNDSRRAELSALAERIRALAEPGSDNTSDRLDRLGFDLVRQLNRVEVCGGCKREMTPDLCHCGETRTMHPPEHQFVPMGCNCYRGANVGVGDEPW